MEYCPPKEKHYKKKGGKCCCGNGLLIKRLPYATISNRTAANELGAPISFLPDQTPQVLWSTPALQPTSTCLNGPLRTWFDATTGQFTIQETGLYSFTFTGDSITPTGGLGYHLARLGYNLVDVDKRCINSNLTPTANNAFTAFPLPNATGVTVSATLALLAGDVITFVFEALQTGTSVPVGFIFEVDVVQLTRLDKNKIENTMFV